MSHNNDSSNTFWPGYVDAISTLVLNLLFVVCVFSVAVFLLGLQMSKMGPKAKQDLAEERPEAKAGQSSAQAPVPVKLQAAVSETQAALAEAASELRLRPGPSRGGCPSLSVQFSDEVFVVNKALAGRFEQYHKAWTSSGCQQLTVVAHGDEARSISKRAAFLRVMAVRNALIDAGFAPDAVDIEIAPLTAQNNEQTVLISGDK